MGERVEVEADRRIVLPERLLAELGLGAGSRLLVEGRDGYLILLPEPEDYVRRLRGLHREVWSEASVDAYLDGERSGWRE